MDDVQALLKLNSKLAAARAKAQRAEGVLDQLKTTLKKDWGCSSVNEPRTKLEELTRTAKKLRKQFQEKLDVFEKEWADELGVS